MSAYDRLKRAIQGAAVVAGGVLQVALGYPEDDDGYPVFVFYPAPPEENGRSLQAGALWEPESPIGLIVQQVGAVAEQVSVSDTDVGVGYLYDKITVGAGLTKAIITDGNGYQTVQISLAI